MPTYVCSAPAGSLFTVMHIIKLFDYQKPYSNYILAKVLALVLLLFVLPARAQQDPNLRQIAAFPDHQVTGITVASDGRIFVNFPFWSYTHSFSVAQLGEKSALTPYPDSSWNSERRSSRSTIYLCSKRCRGPRRALGA